VCGNELVIGGPYGWNHRVGAFGRATFFSVPLKL
jgi:hypothetical protein